VATGRVTYAATGPLRDRRAAQRAYYQAHRAERLAWQKEYRTRNRDARIDYDRGRYAATREDRLAETREYSVEQAEAIRGRRLVKGYGITLAEYNAAFDAQGGRCAICRQPETNVDKRSGITRRLAVDHDHFTGTVRNLLCGRCNLGLGLLGDDPTLLRAMAEYVELFR
jgi:hypothetical protein